jgi:hypothetical protein
MGYKPPRGISPPQLRGRRTGRRPKLRLSEESAGPLAQAMRSVLASAAESDKTHEQQRLRKWLEENPTSFLRHLARLELAERPRPALTAAEVDALAVRLADALGAAVAKALERHGGPEGRGVIVAGPPERDGRRDPSSREGPLVEDFLE